MLEESLRSEALAKTTQCPCLAHEATQQVGSGLLSVCVRARACSRVHQGTDGSLLPRGPVTSSDSVELWVVALGPRCLSTRSRRSDRDSSRRHALSGTRARRHTQTSSSWTAGLLTFSRTGRARAGAKQRRHRLGGVRRVGVGRLQSDGENWSAFLG